MSVPGLSAEYCSLAPCVKNVSIIADDALKLLFGHGFAFLSLAGLCV